MHSHFEQDIIIEKYNRQYKAWEENVKREFIPEIRPFKSSWVNWGMQKTTSRTRADRCSEKTREDFKLSSLANLQAQPKQEMKAKAEL